MQASGRFRKVPGALRGYVARGRDLCQGVRRRVAEPRGSANAFAADARQVPLEVLPTLFVGGCS